MTTSGSKPQEIGRMIEAFKTSQAILVAVDLGIPDLLETGARSVDDLAAAAGAHAPTLYRLLRALAGVGVLDEQDDGRFALTPVGQPLRTNVPGSIAGWAKLQGRDYFWKSWGNLRHSVRTGENAFSALYGEDVWSYRAARPEENAMINVGMMSLTNASSQAILAAYDFGRYGTIVDVAGGNGALLAAILRKHTGVRGVVLDQPHVVIGAAKVLEEAGVGDRCTTVGGSMFDHVPGGGDAYVLKNILHDWEDEDCVRILRSCRRATSAGSRLLVIERVVGPPNEDPSAKFADLHMLVLPGGCERTEVEWRALLDAGGFQLERVVPTASGLCVIEGVPCDV